MVLVVVVAVLALTVVAATGHLTTLAHVRVRALRLLAAALVIQVGTAVLVPGSALARVVALVLTVVLVALFLGGNASLPGVPLVAAGLLLNVVVIAANGAMPVSPTAAARAGLEDGDRPAAEPLREPVDDSTRLPLLGDRIAVPVPGWPQVVSVGDLLVAAGIGLLLVAGSVPAPDRPAPGRRRAQPSRVARSTAWANESTTRGSYS